MKDHQLSPEDEQRIENELKALNLELNFGATHFHASDDAPPELIGRFLDNVTRFHEAKARGELVPIHRFAKIGKLPPADALQESELEPRIQALLHKLTSRSVMIDRPAHLSARDYYRFLTEEFLNELIPDQFVPGMINGFVYNELRHDSPAFICDHVEETLLDLLHLESEFRGEWISKHCRNQTKAISKAEALKSIHRFRARYRAITLLAFQPAQILPTHDALYLFFGIAWEGLPAKGGEPERYEGPGVSQIAWEEGEWRVEGIMMPGFAF